MDSTQGRSCSCRSRKSVVTCGQWIPCIGAQRLPLVRLPNSVDATEEDGITKALALLFAFVSKISVNTVSVGA